MMDFDEYDPHCYDSSASVGDDENSLVCHRLRSPRPHGSNKNASHSRENSGRIGIDSEPSHEKDRFRDCSREIVIITLCTILPGKRNEEMSILGGKLRGIKVLQEPGSQWVEQGLHRSKGDGMIRVIQATAWKDSESFKAYFLTPDTMKFYADHIPMLVPQSIDIQKYARVISPFGHVNIAGHKRSLLDMQGKDPSSAVFNPFEVQPQAVCIYMKLKPDPATIADFEQLLWSSEACARQIEQGCLRYEVLTPLHEEGGFEEPPAREVTIYAVFQTKFEFFNHASKGCSMFGERAASLCLQDPVASMFPKNAFTI